MNQQDANRLMSNERVQELGRLHAELGTMKWVGADEGWERAIAAVRKHIEERTDELMRKYAPEVVEAIKAIRQAAESGE